MKALQNIFVITLIAATQFGSLGILLNKHYCKGALTEVSVLLSNKGCSDDLTFLDRLTHTEHDCQMAADTKGVRKAPCCDFESAFGKIYLFQEDDDQTSLSVNDVVIDFLKLELPTLPIQYTDRVSTFVPRPPPDYGIEVCVEFCRFLI